MHIVPAMDLRADRCVHTERDRNRFDHVIEQNPLVVAASWREAGADTLFLADLDGFQYREPRNVHTVREIREANPALRMLVSGGVCCEEHILIWLDAGVDGVVITQKNVKSDEFLEALGMDFPGRMYVAVELSPEGGAGILARRYGRGPEDLVMGLDSDGISGVVFHTTADTQEVLPKRFPSEKTLEILWRHPAKCCLHEEDVLRLAEAGVDGLVIGRPLYEGSFNNNSLLSLLTTGGVKAS